MTYDTHTDELGKITFLAPAATDTYADYVWIEVERGWPSRERRQICQGGGFDGATIISTSGNLKAVAQRWLRQRRQWAAK